MFLKEELKVSREGGLFPVTKFRVPKVKKARALLAAKFTEADSMPPIVEIEDVADRLSRAAKAKALDEISRKDWKKAGWCLWLDGRELAKEKFFLNAYLDRIATESRRSAYKKLISAYVREYGPKRPGIQAVGEFLARGVVKWDWVWASRQKELKFFDAEGPSLLAAACLSSEKDASNFLEAVGLGNDLGVAGYACEAFSQCLRMYRKLQADRAEELLSKVLDWAVDEDGLRYPGLEGQLADALLLRWANSTPPGKVQKKTEVFLLQHFGDPRVASVAKSKWHHVDDDAKSVMLRWLVGAALEQFLQVVDKVAMPSQWRYRRAFWTAYYKAGVIDEAWVAFAWEGQVQARRSFGSHNGFANLEGGSISRDHAVLLMKIGPLTIADWSHNGKCHIWTESSKEKPKLYKASYDRWALTRRSSNRGVVHSSPQSGNWQGKVSKYIADHTGIRLSEKAYMPKRRR